MLIANFANDLLKHVLDRDQSSGATVLINHQGHMHLAALKLFEQVAHPFGFWNTNGLAQQRAQTKVGRGGAKPTHQIFHIQHSHNMVQTSLVNWNAAVAFLMNHQSNLSQIIGVFNAFHRGARSHDAAHHGLTQFHDILHDRRAGGINSTLAPGVLNALKQVGA